ncbi:DUF2332 family protein [Bacillus haikouensis]|jgi:hypothetical protein|uniref:DUF2332 family protein n=1 Tax=Bacillus haikouensis TaxID=1510468 RepID=UPI0015556AEF|nr:DUF2332 family protein [Bacillus haikouensis]NQD65943.1 DUF2332 family protein [Bacillus haikouensis]
MQQSSPLYEHLAIEIPKKDAVCHFHTHAASHIPEESKRELQTKVKEIGKNRDMFHLYNNIRDRKLHLDCFINGKEECYVIGKQMDMENGLIGI